MFITLSRATNWWIRDSKIPVGDNVEAISLGRRCRNWTSEHGNTISYKEFPRYYHFMLKENITTFIDDNYLNTTAKWLNFVFGFDYHYFVVIDPKNYNYVSHFNIINSAFTDMPLLGQLTSTLPLIEPLKRSNEILNLYVSRVGVISFTFTQTFVGSAFEIPTNALLVASIFAALVQKIFFYNVHWISSCLSYHINLNSGLTSRSLTC